jgi:MOSC domain-containing protein YiiM
MNNSARVIAVSLKATHALSKTNQARIHLLAGLGVKGDAHAGATVKHRSRVAKDPTQPNLRQIHLIHAELFDELHAKGFAIEPGLLGENITTLGIELLAQPKGTLLHIGEDAIVEITGLRNPCSQLNGLYPGLMDAVLDRDADGKLIRKAGIMGIVLAAGLVKAGDRITTTWPAPPFEALDRV